MVATPLLLLAARFRYFRYYAALRCLPRYAAFFATLLPDTPLFRLRHSRYITPFFTPYVIA